MYKKQIKIKNKMKKNVSNKSCRVSKITPADSISLIEVSR